MGIIAVVVLLALAFAWAVTRGDSETKRHARVKPMSPPDPEPVRFTMTMTVTHEEVVAEDDESAGAEREREDQWAAVAAEPVRCSIDVHVTYRDAGGRQTRRHITVQEFDYAAPRHMYALCHLRRARRTFYLNRVVEAVDPETGEVLDSLHEFLRTRYEASPEFSLDRLFATERNALRVLLYVGRADGRLSAAERAIIHRVARELAGDERLTDTQINKILAEFTAPSKAVFQQAIRTLVKEESLERRLLVLRGAEEMVATQATVHPDEAAALEYMRPRLTAPDTTPPPEPKRTLATYGMSLDAREREAAALLEASREAWQRDQERAAADAAAEAVLPPRCGVCFEVTGARLALTAGARVGETARCDRCGFDQVVTERGAQRPEGFLIQYAYRGVPLPPGVPAPFPLPHGRYGDFIGRIEQRQLDYEQQLQALIEAFSARTIVEPQYSVEKARILTSREVELQAIDTAMQREYDTLRAEVHTVRERLKRERSATGHQDGSSAITA